MTTTIPMLGEFVTRNIPLATVVKHTDILAALSGAGLPTCLAGGLSLAQALGRVVKGLARGGLVHNLREGKGHKLFQLDSKAIDTTTSRMMVTWRADVRLDTVTGVITSSDPAVEAQARSLIAAAQADVKTADIARVVVRVLSHECGGRVFAKGGSTVQFFVLHKDRAAADKLEAFLAAIGCTLTRIPVVDILAVQALLATLTTPAVAAAPAAPAATALPSAPAGCGIPAVVDVVKEGLMHDIFNASSLYYRLKESTREATIIKECARILEVAEYAESVRPLLGDVVEIILDYAEGARSALRKLYAEKLAAKEACPVAVPVMEETEEIDERSFFELAMENATVAPDGRLRYPRLEH